MCRKAEGGVACLELRKQAWVRQSSGACWARHDGCGQRQQCWARDAGLADMLCPLLAVCWCSGHGLQVPEWVALLGLWRVVLLKGCRLRCPSHDMLCWTEVVHEDALLLKPWRCLQGVAAAPELEDRPPVQAGLEDVPLPGGSANLQAGWEHVARICRKWDHIAAVDREHVHGVARSMQSLVGGGGPECMQRVMHRGQAAGQAEPIRGPWVHAEGGAQGPGSRPGRAWRGPWMHAEGDAQGPGSRPGKAWRGP